MYKTSFHRLSPKEFDAALLKRLTEEGRVYIDFPKEITKDTYTREILDYVQAIRDYVSDPWREKIDNLWHEILDDACLADFLTMKRGLQAGHMNRYAVTNLVCRMQNNGIYRQDVTMHTLHLRLERTNTRNKYYVSCGNYLLPDKAKMVLKRLLAEYNKNLFIHEQKA